MRKDGDGMNRQNTYILDEYIPIIWNVFCRLSIPKSSRENLNFGMDILSDFTTNNYKHKVLIRFIS